MLARAVSRLEEFSTPINLYQVEGERIVEREMKIKGDGRYEQFNPV